MSAWVREWNKEGVVAIDTRKFMAEKGSRPFLPKRWVVERTFSWLGQNRRMSKDYERLPESSEAFGLHSRGDEPPDGEEISALVRLFRQFQKTILRSPFAAFCVVLILRPSLGPIEGVASRPYGRIASGYVHELARQ